MDNLSIIETDEMKGTELGYNKAEKVGAHHHDIFLIIFSNNIKLNVNQ